MGQGECPSLLSVAEEERVCFPEGKSGHSLRRELRQKPWSKLFTDLLSLLSDTAQDHLSGGGITPSESDTPTLILIN